MMPHFSPLERDQFGISRPSQSHPHSPHYRSGNVLPSIGSVFGDLGRSLPPAPHTTPYPTPSYSPESPNRAPPAITQFYNSSDEPWTIHKQGQKHPLPIAPTVHYPRPSDYPLHSGSPNEFQEFLRPGPSHVIGNRGRSELEQRSPTSETTYSFQDSISNVNDSETNMEMCSDQGDSEFTSGVGDTLSQAGSSVSQMYLRQFTCKICKLNFKCDSLLRKHEMKHTKPFRCHVPDCKRKILGFTSANDRDRHMNSVHKRSSGRGAVGYDCIYDHCQGNGKIFWRLDNFRNHLKKKHGKIESELDEFLKRAEAECRRVYSHQPVDSQMDTRSEPGCLMPNTPMEGATSAMTEEFPISRQAKRTRLHSTPPLFSSQTDPEGRSELPISPVSRGPHQDLASDLGDRMDLDETPAPESVATTTRTEGPQPSTKRSNSSQAGSAAPSRLSTKAPIEREEQIKAGYRRDARSEDRLRRLNELYELIKKYPKIIDEYNSLVKEEREENEDGGQEWPQYQPLYQVNGSENSAQTMPVSKVRNNPRLQRSQGSTTREIQLDRIEENEQDRMEHEQLTSRTLRNNTESRHHALRQYYGQSPTDESPMSRLLSTGGVASPDAGFSDNQSALISPPISIASPTQAAATELSPTQQQRQSIVIPDDENSAPESSRAQRRSSPPIPVAAAARPSVLLPNEKSTTCRECDKRFTMPSKLKKHMKRHSRPFACTFRGCGKLFGSKGDWKRHENSQHFQLELWKCGVIPPKSSALCGKLSFRRESHTTHLRNVHSITDKTEIANKTKEAHIGRNNFKTFWCGFCPTIPGQDSPKGRVVLLKNKGLDGWDERFDHLGKHFIEDGLKIGKYEFGDDDDQYGQTQSSSDDDDDGEIPVSEPIARAPPTRVEDDVLEDIGDGGVANDKKVLEFTAPEGQRDRLTKKIVKPSKTLHVNSQIFWYCCNDGRQCPDPGPYSEALHRSCIACDHRRCVKCGLEKSTADKEGGVMIIEKT